MTPNWIEDVNRFHLKTPPLALLRRLWDFDSSLVIIPSKQDCVYRLAQRRPISLPKHLLDDPFFNQSDTQMLASYGLIPVTTILAEPNWFHPNFFKELENRAPWRMGGAEKVLTALEEEEMREEAQKKIDEDLRLTDISRQGWRSYQRRTGARVTIDPTRLDPRAQRPATPK